MTYEPDQQQLHSAGWIAQAWISFAISVVAGLAGIYFLPADGWIRAFLALSFAMVISSSISLSKTVRDSHESTRLVKKIDDAKLTKLLTENSAEL